MARILITGATGMIGSALGKVLASEGHSLVIVSRSKPEVAKSKVPFLCEAIQADLVTQKIDSVLLQDIEYVIHLAGESVAAKRWTDDYKQKMIESRVVSTAHLRESFTRLPKSKLKGYIGASAIGYYPSSHVEIYDESSEPGEGFLTDLVMQWEKEHQKWNEMGQNLKLSIVRIGVVHGYPGGALGEVIPLFKQHFGSALGSGRQWMSWVDIKDVCGIFKWLINKDIWSPVYNAVAPDVVTNLEWSEQLASALKVGLLPKVPSFVLNTVLGERACILLESQRVAPKKLQEEGYAFEVPSLEKSFEQIALLFENATHAFVAEQFIEKPLNEVFDFFSQAQNLEKISPPFLKFQVQSQSTPAIEEGTVIQYRLKVRGIPAKWRSRILDWKPPYEFSDLQEVGPYKYWYHTHSFSSVPGGTLIRDWVRYGLPMAPLGDWVAQKYVRSEIQQIFDYRQKVIGELFGK